MLGDIFQTYRQAFRIYMRQITRPRTIEEAEEKRLFWSKCYAISGLLAFSTATYITFKEDINFKYDKNKKEDDVVEKLSKSSSKVYRFRNFSKVGEVYYNKKDSNENEPVAKIIPVETSEKKLIQT